MSADALRSNQDLLGGWRCLRWSICVVGTVASRAIATVFAEKLGGMEREDADLPLVLLHLDSCTNEPRWHRVVGRSDLDVPIEMHGTLPVLVVAKGFEGQRLQVW